MENENDDQEWKGYVFAAGLFVVAMPQSLYFQYLCVSRELIAYVYCGYDSVYILLISLCF